MTGERHHAENHDSPFYALESIMRDPVFDFVLEEVAEAQDDLRKAETVDWYEAETKLSPVNELWESTGWPGAVARVTGRLRLTDNYSVEDTSIREFTKHLRQHADSAGMYYDVEGLPLVSGYFSAALNDDYEIDEDRRVGLSFIMPKKYAEDEDAESDFIMYPSDIGRIEFARPSPQGIENNLSYHFPEIYQQLRRVIPQGAGSSKAIVDGLKRFMIPSIDEKYSGYPINRDLAEYIYYRLDFGNEHYDVQVNGPVHSIDAEDSGVEHETRVAKRKYRGKICGIMMEDDGDAAKPMLRPSLILAVPESASHETFYACIVPAESLVSIRKSPPQTMLGRLALMKFTSPDDIAEHFRDLSWLSQEFHTATERTEEAYTEITQPMKDDFAHVIGYDSVRNCILISLDDYIARIAADFEQRVAQLARLDPRAPVLDEHYDRIARELQSAGAQDSVLMPGDTIVTDGPAIVIDPVSKSSLDIFKTGETNSVQGIFMRFVPIRVPNKAATKNLKPGAVQLAAMIRPHAFIDEARIFHPAPFASEKIAILLPPTAGTRFVKLD